MAIDVVTDFGASDSCITRPASKAAATATAGTAAASVANSRATPITGMGTSRKKQSASRMR